MTLQRYAFLSKNRYLCTQNHTSKMKKAVFALLLFATQALAALAQGKADSHCLDFMGIPLEGSPDSLVTALKRVGFTEWGTSEDGEGLHFRGDFYGVRSKLMVSLDEETKMVSSAYVTVGPYRTKDMFQRNYQYFLLKMQREYGQFSARGDAFYCVGDYGIVKISNEQTATGSYEIKVFFFNTAPFYKDAASIGLKGSVMEVMTENPVAENSMEHYDKLGRIVQPDIVERQYNQYGYLLKAEMKEASGENSLLEYVYDRRHRLVKRTLTNRASGITYVNEYVYNDEDELTTQRQKAFDDKRNCVLSITLDNSYDDYDDNGNWTKNSLKLTYWDPDSGTQHATVVQKRSISYWED